MPWLDRIFKRTDNPHSTSTLPANRFGKDMTGLSDVAKKDFVKVAQSALRGQFNIDTKANEVSIGFLAGRFFR